ncbi:MAG: helix-turn-helix domain-containing protein [Spirochaetes bacterium]|nr:helix-turn-helix domain-containing protein [Spirochaetota bacterium]
MDELPPPLEIRSFFYREQGPRYQTQPHQRNIWQWYCVVYGDVEMTVEGAPHLLKAGTSILVPPGATRSPRCHRRAPGYVICEFTHALDLGALSARPAAVPESLRESLLALVDELRGAELHQRGLMSWVLFTRLLLHQLRTAREARRGPAGSRAPADPTTRSEELARAMDDFMSRRFREDLGREGIARAFRLSPSQCARVYKAARGRTILSRLTELRMHEARLLLTESTLAVGDIALEVGFDSFSHFSQAFRAHVGVTPKAYRQSGGRTYGPTGDWREYGFRSTE